MINFFRIMASLEVTLSHENNFKSFCHSKSDTACHSSCKMIKNENRYKQVLQSIYKV